MSHATQESGAGPTGRAPRSARSSNESVFPKTELRERLTTGVLSWLLANIDRFDPPQEDHILDVTPEHIQPGRRRKAFGELGAALRIVQRAPELRDRPEVRSIADAWLSMARRRNIFFEARRRVHLFPQMAVAAAVLAALDEAPAGVLRALQSVLDRSFMDRTERHAWHKLDLKYYFDAAGLRHGFEDDAALFYQSSLPAPPALPYVQAMDLYAITHLIFHFTDFGAGSIRVFAGPHLAGIRGYVASALAMCVCERDPDLTAELVMSRICLGECDDALNREAVSALCETQQPGGFVPDRRWLRGLEPQEDPARAAEEEFFAVYHPTVVTLFLLACDMTGLRTNHCRGDR